MSRTNRFAAVVALVLVGGLSFGQMQDKAAPARGQLPSGWSKLGLSAQQKSKVYEVQTKFRNQITALQVQIDDLKAKQLDECVALLTDAQKALLAEQAKAVKGVKGKMSGDK